MQYSSFIISRLAHFFRTFLHAKPFVFDNISMTSLMFSNRLLPVLLFNFQFFGKNLPKYCYNEKVKKYVK